MFEVPTAARLVTSRSVYPSPARLLLRPFLQFQTWNLSQSYATQTSLGATTRPLGATTRPPQKHKKVTVFNDDGHIRWGDLTIREKVARTTQQSFNFALIAGGAVMTVAVITLLYTNVFSPQSSTSYFNRAVDRIRKDPKCIELLGSGKDITAYGEPSSSRWRRNRPIASRTETDKFGNETLSIHFNVSGPLNDGVVNMVLLRRNGESQFEYVYLALDVAGHSRLYLENSDAKKKPKSTPGKILGWKWT